MWLMAISTLFYNCNKKVDITRTELRTEFGDSTKFVSAFYFYFPTNKENIYWVEREIKFINGSIEHNYFLSVKDSLTYIGQEVNNVVYFLPYLIPQKEKESNFDFNNGAIKKDFIFLDAFGNFNFIENDSSNTQFYTGNDFGRAFAYPVKIGVKQGYITTSISDTSNNIIRFKMFKTQTLKGNLKGIQNVHYLE